MPVAPSFHLTEWIDLDPFERIERRRSDTAGGSDMSVSKLLIPIQRQDNLRIPTHSAACSIAMNHCPLVILEVGPIASDTGK